MFDLKIHSVISPQGKKFDDFYTLEAPNWVNIVPVTSDGEVVLVKQYRHGIDEVSLEVPGGVVDPGEDPLLTAKRELEEETGYIADEVISLGSIFPNPAILSNRCYIYFAHDVYKKSEQRLDDAEDIAVVLVPLKEIPKIIALGEISHALIVSTFTRYFLKNGLQWSAE